MATCPKCQTWCDENSRNCVSCGEMLLKAGNVVPGFLRNEVKVIPIWSALPKWAVAIACTFSFHHGLWEYDSHGQCSQTRICIGCGEQNFRIEHDVKDWESDGFFSSQETGVCERCKQSQTRKTPNRSSKG